MSVIGQRPNVITFSCSTPAKVTTFPVAYFFRTCKIKACSVLFRCVLFCSVVLCCVLFRSFLFCSIVLCCVPFCFVLFRCVVFCSVVLCSVPFCFVLFRCVVLCSVPLCCVVFYSVQFRSVLFRSVVLCCVPFRSVLFLSVPFCSVLSWTHYFFFRAQLRFTNELCRIRRFQYCNDKRSYAYYDLKNKQLVDTPPILDTQSQLSCKSWASRKFVF